MPLAKTAAIAPNRRRPTGAMFGEGKYLVAKVVLMMETPKRIAKN
jgi:hypothetical protein